MRSDDPLRDFERHDAKQTAKQNELPKCEYCGEPIQQDDAVRINNGFICDDCLNSMREIIE